MLVRIADLKVHLFKYLGAVESGSEITVIDHDPPIARISPIPDPGRRIRLIPPVGDFLAIRDRERVPANWTVDSARMLREECGVR
jgi:antitoxin (DNA-binding transcriptional repressor) of toxin-antitoxin stability system